MASPFPDHAPEKPGLFSIPAPLVRLVQVFAWDGALPLVVALAPVVVKAIWANPPAAAGVFLVLAPPVAALIRAHIGWHQIARRCAGRAPLLRQVAMAVAIVLLLAFEGSVGVLTFAKRIPPSAWWFPFGVYAGYLAMITLALRAPRKSAHLPQTDAGLSA